jgi:hypothetical protein
VLSAKQLAKLLADASVAESSTGPTADLGVALKDIVIHSDAGKPLGSQMRGLATVCKPPY